MGRRRTQRIVLAVVVLLGLMGIGFARGGGDDTSSGDGFFASGEQEAEERGVGGGFHDDGAGDGGFVDGSTADEGFGSNVAVGGGSIGGTSGASGVVRAPDVTEYAADGDGSADAGAPPTTPLAASGYLDRIIKDGRMEVEVPEGRFGEAFSAALGLAGKVGGTVVASQSNGASDGRSSGEVTIRVPAERFEQLLTTAGTLGDVKSSQVTSQDVSGEFTDLESRLRHLQAQERFYLDLLNRAKVVGDAVAVNQHLSGILAEMEQVKGRLRLLDERTSYSRLTIAMFEPGIAPIPGLLQDARDGVLADAWHQALRGLQSTIGALLVGSFTMAPLAVLALLGWALWRRLRPRPVVVDPRPAAEPQEGPLHVG